LSPVSHVGDTFELVRGWLIAFDEDMFRISRVENLSAYSGRFGGATVKWCLDCQDALRSAPAAPHEADQVLTGDPHEAPGDGVCVGSAFQVSCKPWDIYIVLAKTLVSILVTSR
jgi:hypothetical protein